MTINFPGPYELEINYVVSGKNHVQRLNVGVDGIVEAGTPMASINFATRDGSTINAVTAIDEWIDLIKVLFDTTVTFGEVTLWKYTPQSFIRAFITSYTSSAVGTNVGTIAEAYQRIFTFRTMEGGIMRVVLLETNYAGKDRTTYSQMGGAGKALADYVTGTSTWMLGRDTSCPIATISDASSENEKLFRSRYRN